MKNKTSKNRREFITQVSKIVREWNSHLEIVGRPQVIENSRQCLLLPTLFYRKQSLGAPVKFEEPSVICGCAGAWVDVALN